LPLAFLSEGEEGEILEVVGRGGLNRHLCDMGLTPSTRVRVLKSCPSGPMLVQVREARIALGREITMKILVSREVKI